MEARDRLRKLCGADVEARRDIFRQELGTNVRSASPFLLALAAANGASIDRLLDRLTPAPRWPRAPALSKRPITRFRRAREPYQQFVVSTLSGDRKVVRTRGLGHGLVFMQSGDDWASLEAVDHSLEVEARIGWVKFETLFGVLRIELDFSLPETLATACVGRAVGGLIDHAALRGCDWPVTAVEEGSPLFGRALIVETGSEDFRMPWMR